MLRPRPDRFVPELNVQGADGSRRLLALEKERITIGRSRDNDVFLPDQWLSRAHAAVRAEDGAYFVEDLGSKNGTLVNGRKLEDEHQLRPGDVITLGEHTLTFSEEDSADAIDDEPAGTQIFSAAELQLVPRSDEADPEALARQNRVLGILSEAARALLDHRPIDEVFEQVLDFVFEAVPTERAAILLMEGPTARPIIKASRSKRGEAITKVSRSIARRVVDQRVSVILPNVMEDAALKAQESIVASGIRSALCAPLWYTSSKGEDNRVIGLIYLDSLMSTQPYTEDDLQVLTALSHIAAAKIENVRLLEESLEMRRLEDDMRIAAEIQTSLLPDEAPGITGYGLVGSNRPCRTIGGDYYDFEIEEDELLMALGDVSGKGTGAALLMTVLRAAVRGQWTDPSVAEAVKRINRTVCQNVPDGKYITFFLSRLDPSGHALRYVNAGHNPPLLVRPDGEVEELKDGGMVLGMFEDTPYEEGVVTLGSGDTLLVFSDGVTETWNPEDEEFGEERLAAIARSGADLDAAGLQSAILRELDAFVAGGKATDDRTLIVLKQL